MRWCVLLCACFVPTPPNGALHCAADGSCPNGYRCVDGACWKNGSGPDLAVGDLGSNDDLTSVVDLEGPDLAGQDFSEDDLSSVDLNVDLATVDLEPAIVTVNDIDTGKVGPGAVVTIKGLVVTGPMIFTSKTAPRCKYGGFLQDPIGTAPCGLQIFDNPPICSPVDMDCVCPAIGATGYPIDALTNISDVVDITGTVTVFNNAHELTLITAVSKTGATGVIFPVTDTGPLFAPSTAGYLTYESMLVKIKPASAFTIGSVDSFGAFIGDNVNFTGMYRGVYGAGGTFPASNSTWHSITGIAQPLSTGSIVPRVSTDFAP
jgi:hypothetical protein